MIELPVLEKHLPYVARLETRPRETINLVVVHCTELPDLATARTFGERIHYPESLTGNSGHFYIERNGDIEQWVPVDKIAHHVRGFNPCSIGVELVNSGRFPDWLDSNRQVMTEPYPKPQIQSLVLLLSWLDDSLASLKWIAGHEELDPACVPASDNPALTVRRKLDPGPMFPWTSVLRSTTLRRYKPT